MLRDHKSFRPCRNFFAQEGGCRYGEACHFSHKEVGANMQRCYKCGVEVDNVILLMKHRKEIHNEMCKDAAIARCRFNQQSCYLNHPEGEQASGSGGQGLRKDSDFCRSSHPSQPPGTPASNEQDHVKAVLRQIAGLLQSLLL